MPKRIALCVLLIALAIAWLWSGTGITVPSGSAGSASRTGIVLPENLAYKRWAILAGSPPPPPGVADQLIAQLSATPGIELVEREQIDAALKELGLSQSLGDSVRGRLQLGRILKVDALMVLSLAEAAPSAAPPANTGSAGADPSAMRAAPSARFIKVVVADCRQGARLREAYLACHPRDAADLAGRVGQIVEAVCSQYPDGLRQVIGLAPFVCRNLAHDHDQYQAGFAHLLAEALAAPGTAVIETQEAQAIRRERDLAAASPIERTVPLFVEAEYEVLGAAGAAEPEVRLSIRLTRSDVPLETIERDNMRLGQVGRFLADRVAPAVLQAAGARGAAPLSNEAQAGRLAARAAEFDSLGMWALAAQMREALLLVQPEDCGQRAALLEDYGRSLPGDPAPLPDARRRPMRLSEEDLQAFDAWCRRRAGLFHRCLDHLEYLIRQQGVTPQAAVELAEIALRSAPVVPVDISDRVSAVLQPLEEQKKRFLGGIYRDILGLPLRSVGGQERRAADGFAFPAWQRTLTTWCFVRLDGLTLGQEDLDFARKVLTEAIPNHQRPSDAVLFFLQHQATPYQMDPAGQSAHVLLPASRYRYSDEQYDAFLRQLAASQAPLPSVYGRYGLLLRLYDRSGIRATQEMLFEASAIVDLYAASQAAPSPRAQQSDKCLRALVQLRDGIQQRLAEAPPAAPQDDAAADRAPDRPAPADRQAARPVAAEPPAHVTYRPLHLRTRNAPARTAPLESSLQKTGLPAGTRMQVRPCAKGLDAWWTDQAVALMREPGWLDVIFTTAPGLQVEDVCWDGQAAWIATEDAQVWLVQPDGSPPVPVGKDVVAGNPLAIGLHAIEPGRVLCVSAWNYDPRITCTLLEYKGGQTAQRRIHTVVGKPEYRAFGLGLSATRHFGQSLLWMLEPDCTDQGRTLLVGLRGDLKTAIRGFPLAINLHSLQVTPQTVRDDGSQTVLLAAAGRLWGSDTESFWRAPSQVGPHGERAWQPILPLPRTSGPEGMGACLFAQNGAVYAPGGVWQRLYPDLDVSRVLGQPSLQGEHASQGRSAQGNLMMWDYGQSAHYGLLTWNDELMWRKELVVYGVTVDDPPRAENGARLASATEPPGLAFAVLAESPGLGEMLTQGLVEALPAGSPEPVQLASMSPVVHELVQPQARAQRQQLGRAFGADYLLVEHRQDGAVSRISLADARTGVQLLTEQLRRARLAGPQADSLTSRTVRDMVQRLGSKPPRPVAVARLRPIDPGNDMYGEAITYILSRALSTHDQLVVTGAEEISRAAPASPAAETPTGTLVRGSYVLAPAEGKAEPSLSIRLEVIDEEGNRQSVQIENTPSAAIAQAHERLCRLLGVAPAKDAHLVVERACRNLMTRADELTRSGRTTAACNLLQTCLLLQPQASEPRLALLRRQLALLYWPPAFEARGQMDAALYRGWLRQQADSWRKLVHQVEDLIRSGGITQRAAGQVAEAALATPAWAGWGRDLAELEADRRQFLREVCPRIGKLPCETAGKGNQAAERRSWQEALLAQAATRLDGRYSREDLESLRDLLVEVFQPDVPMALPVRLAQRDPWPGADDAAQQEFLADLANSKEPAVALLGRFGALWRDYHHGKGPTSLTEQLDALQQDWEAIKGTVSGGGYDGTLDVGLQGLRARLAAAPRSPCTQPSAPLLAQDRDSGRVVRLVPIELQVRMHPDRERPMQFRDDVPIEEQLRQHREKRVVPMWAIAGFNRESGIGRGESWHCTQGGDLDVFWSDRSVVAVLKPDAAAEVMAGDDLAIHDVRCDGRQIWVADLKEGITVLTPAGEQVARISRAEGLPPADQALLVHPLGEGKALVCGSLGTEQRAWIATVDQTGPRAQVIHQATRVVARSVAGTQGPSSQQGPQPAGNLSNPGVDAAFLPQWILPIGPRSLLIGRAPSRHAESSDWLPLRVDLAERQVRVFDPQCTNPWGRDVNYFACQESLYATDGSRLWQWAGLGKAWADGLPWRQIAERDWHRSGPDDSLATSMGRMSVLPIGPRLCLPGWDILQRDEQNQRSPILSLWKEYDPADGTCRPLPTEVVPAYPIVPDGYAVSANFGPVMWGWSRAFHMGEHPLAPASAPQGPLTSPHDRADEWRKTVRYGLLVLFRVEVVTAGQQPDPSHTPAASGF